MRIENYAQNNVIPSIPTGEMRTFGAYGPLYQVGELTRKATDGRLLVDVNVIETGERLSYPLDQLLHDPRAK